MLAWFVIPSHEDTARFARAVADYPGATHDGVGTDDRTGSVEAFATFTSVKQCKQFTTRAAKLGFEFVDGVR